jgi:hypothetical protein
MRLNYWTIGSKQRIYINHNYRRTLKAYLEPVGNGWRLIIKDKAALEDHQRLATDTRPEDLKALLMAEIGQSMGEDLGGLSWSELVQRAKAQT